MPTDKRARKREAKLARQEALRLEQQRAARRRRIRSLLMIAAGVVLVVFLVTRVQGGDDEDLTAGDASTTSGKPTTTVKPGTTPCPKSDGSSPKKATFDGPPKKCLTPGKAYSATITTDVGSFEVALDHKAAPATVNNFVFLSRYHFYDGVVFHRVIPGFVVQGGDPEGTGTGGPGYQFSDELPKPKQYKLGSLAMANSGPDTNGSQFFVITGPQGTALPPSYSLFGRVTSGLDVVKKIEADGAADGTPKTIHKMVSVKITETTAKRGS